jgi:hypothetical protein
MLDTIGKKRASALLQSDIIPTYMGGPIKDYSAIGLTRQKADTLASLPHRIILTKDELGQIPLMGFLEALQNLERLLGYRAYVEWAMRFEDGKPCFYILQIARADFKGGLIDFATIPNPIFTGHSVYGFLQNQNFPAIVYCPSDWAVSMLHEFDTAHPEGYVLLYNSSLKYGQIMGLESPLTISTVPHARVIVEIQNRTHARLPISHWAGQIEKTGKVFAVMEDTTHLPDRLKAQMTPYSDSGLLVYDGPVVVNASARQNRLVLSLPPT